MVGNGLTTGNLARVAAKALAERQIKSRNISPTCTTWRLLGDTNIRAGKPADMGAERNGGVQDSGKRKSTEIGNKTSPLRTRS